MSLDYEIDGAVAIATLNRPDVLNAFNDELGYALVEAVRNAATDDSVRCLVITGAGRAFSSGEDLGALAGEYERGTAPELGQTLINRYNPLVRALRETPKPVVAAINGVAAGAGASLALACDFRIASDRAKLVLAFIKVGLIPDTGALWHLSRMVGTARAFRLAATGDPLGTDEALALGLLDRVVAADAFDAEWRSFAAELAAGPTEAYGIAKHLVAFASEHSLEEQLEEEVHAQTRAGRTDDHLEGVTAFLAKRPPQFKGH
ncbi:MAG: enoyl-CoA hydratase/isomerase family protein [Actinobacteria bacterium]|nr:enoyl-CoA hydratase/isomerase family protein [Actinomycetota bacterium]